MLQHTNLIYVNNFDCIHFTHILIYYCMSTKDWVLTARNNNTGLETPRTYPYST